MKITSPNTTKTATTKKELLSFKIRGAVLVFQSRGELKVYPKTSFDAAKKDAAELRASANRHKWTWHRAEAFSCLKKAADYIFE